MELQIEVKTLKSENQKLRDTIALLKKQAKQESIEKDKCIQMYNKIAE